MERKVTKKKLTALFTVFVIIANLFAPYSVLAERASDDPYMEVYMHPVEDISQKPDPSDWSEDTLMYYYDVYDSLANDNPSYDISDVSESKEHLVTFDFIIKNVEKNINAYGLNIKFDTSVLEPAFIKEVIVKQGLKNKKYYPLTVTSEFNDFVTLGDMWTYKSPTTFDGIDTIRTDCSITQKKTYVPEGYIAATMTFRVKDGKGLEDIKPSVFSLKTGSSGVAQGIKLVTFPDTITAVTLEGLDYIEFGGGFAEDDRVTVSSIDIVSGLADNTYYKTEAIDFTGMNLKITYSDGTEKTITKDNMDAEITAGTISIADSEKFAKADNKVTIKAGEKTCEVPYLLPKELNITSDLTQMTVEHGNPIDFAGGKITITYDDNTTTEVLDIKQAITDGLLTPDKTVADVDNNTVTFTYIDGKVTTNQLVLDVTDPIVGIYISTPPTHPEIEYDENEYLGKTTGKINTRHKSGHVGSTEIPMSDPNVKLSQTQALIANCTNVRTKDDGTQAGDLIVNVSYRDPSGNTWTEYTDNGVSYPAQYTVLVNDTIDSIEVVTQPLAINKYETPVSDLKVTGATLRVTTASGHVVTPDIPIDTGMVNFAGYSSTSLSEKEYVVTYGGASTVAGKGLKLKLTDYITKIEINTTKAVETNYNEELTDAHLTEAGVTYTPVYKSGAKGTAAQVERAKVSNYVANPKLPTTYDNVLHKFTENINVQVPLYEYEGAPATKVFSKDFEVKVIDTVKGIEVTSNPSKMVWDYGSTFDSAGMRITRTYQSGARDTNSIAVKGSDKITVANENGTEPVTLTPAKDDFGTNGQADKILKITYRDPNSGEDLSTNFTIYVKDILKSVAINTDPENKVKDSFYHGEAWGIGNGKLDITYESGRTNTVALNSGTSFEFDQSGEGVSTEPTKAEYTAARWKYSYKNSKSNIYRRNSIKECHISYNNHKLRRYNGNANVPNNT